MRTAKVSLSLTETDAFRRLVTLLEQVETHADEQCDIALKGLAEDCRSDLAELAGPR